MTGRIRRPMLALVGCALLASSSCDAFGGRSGNGEYPYRNIRWVIPSAVGGGYDRAARTLRAPLEEALGRTVVIDNQPGANFAIGTLMVRHLGGDCHTILMQGTPHLIFSYMLQEVDFSYADFYPVGAMEYQPGVLVVHRNSPWRTASDLIQSARERPGRVRASVSGLANNNYTALLELQEATGVRFNIVGYDGGAPARTAVLAGEVDFTHAPLFGVLPFRDDLRVLAVHDDENRWPALTDGAPTVNESLGTSLARNGSTYGLFVARSCKEDYPDRFDVLVRAFERAKNDSAYVATLEAMDQAGARLDMAPEEYDAFIREEIRQVEAAIARGLGF